jgi:DNA-binding NtrC family response regulator
MKSNKLNVFIVDDDESMIIIVKNHLLKRFGKELNISAFDNGESCLEKMDEQTHVVILDYYLNGKNGLDILQLIKTKNPSTEVIMLSNNDDIVAAIESLKRGAKDYVIKDMGSLKRISALVNRVSESVRIVPAESRLTNYGAVLFFTFTAMAIVITAIVKYYY